MRLLDRQPRDAAGTPEPETSETPAQGAAPSGDRERTLTRLGVAGAVLAFATLALLWTLVPIYRPTDEASHIGYARELSRGRLPTIETPIPVDGDPRMAQVLRPRDAAHRTIWTANHPPLYYALAAVPIRIGTLTDNPVRAAYAARLLSVGLAALGLVALAVTVLQLTPWRPQLAVAAAGVAGLLPSFVDSAAVAYNDALAFLTATATLAAVTAFLVRGPSHARLAAVAVTASLAALTRASGLLVAAVAVLAVLVGTWRAGGGQAPRRARARAWRACLWAGLVAAAVAATAGWYYLRNVGLYGDLTGSAALLERFGREPRGTVAGWLIEPTLWRLEFRRLWGVEYNLPLTVERLSSRLWLVGLLPLAGLAVAAARALTRRARPWRPHPGRALTLGAFLILLALLEGSLAQFVASGGHAHVRYLFPALALIALGAVVGLAALPGGRRGLPAVAVLAVLGAANLWIRWRYLGDLGVSRVPPLALAAVPLAAGLGLQAVALWRLAPARVAASARPGEPTGGRLVAISPKGPEKGLVPASPDQV